MEQSLQPDVALVTVTSIVTVLQGTTKVLLSSLLLPLVWASL